MSLKIKRHDVVFWKLLYLWENIIFFTFDKASKLHTSEIGEDGCNTRDLFPGHFTIDVSKNLGWITWIGFAESMRTKWVIFNRLFIFIEGNPDLTFSIHYALKGFTFYQKITTQARFGRNMFGFFPKHQKVRNLRSPLALCPFFKVPCKA